MVHTLFHIPFGTEAGCSPTMLGYGRPYHQAAQAAQWCSPTESEVSGTLVSNTMLPSRAYIFFKLRTKELSRPKVRDNLKSRTRIPLSEFLPSSILPHFWALPSGPQGHCPSYAIRNFSEFITSSFPTQSFTLWSPTKPWLLRYKSPVWEIPRVTVLSCKSLAFKTMVLLNIDRKSVV